MQHLNGVVTLPSQTPKMCLTGREEPEKLEPQELLGYPELDELVGYFHVNSIFPCFLFRCVRNSLGKFWIISPKDWPVAFVSASKKPKSLRLKIIFYIKLARTTQNNPTTQSCRGNDRRGGRAHDSLFA